MYLTALQRAENAAKYALLPGMRFGRLTVIEGPRKPTSRHRVICRCDCGEPIAPKTGWLLQGRVVSCGCATRERSRQFGLSNRTHGLTGMPTWRAWAAMFQRCENPRSKSFRNYGGRGIKVCERWRDFANFLADMGERPRPGLSLDRIDVDGDYEPGNCRWATAPVQQNNKRGTHRLTLNGETLSVSEWARRLGIKRNGIYERIRRGWSAERALTEPRQPGHA